MRRVTQEESVRPFDEQAALAELERLRDSIQAARQARQRTSDEFDAFVKSFRTPGSTPTSDRRVAPSRASEPAQQASESIRHPVQSPDPEASTVTVPSNTAEFGDRTAAPSSQLPRRYHLNIRTLGLFAVIAAIALGLLSTRRSRQISPPTRVNAVSNNAASTRNAGTSTAAASQAVPSAAPSRGVMLELRIVRPVWMRVVIDGRKDVEGMVQGGQPLHFTGDHSIIVRVGNGGDVLVTTGNGEESFGQAGQPLTRTFSKP
jgi:RodZ C-terminal domain